MADKTTSQGGVSLKIAGEQQLVDSLNRLASPEERVALMDGIGAYGVSSTHQRFLDKKGPDGQPWRESLRAKETGGQTMRHTARLFQSFSWAATKDSAAWGTSTVYAGIHQFGGDIFPKTKKALAFRLANGSFVMVRKVTMPKRPFLGVDAHDRTRIAGIAGAWGERMVR